MTIEARKDIMGLHIPFTKREVPPGETADLESGSMWAPRRITIIDQDNLRLQVGNVKVVKSVPVEFVQVVDDHYMPTKVVPTSLSVSYPPGRVLERGSINDYNIDTKRNALGVRTTYRWRP